MDEAMLACDALAAHAPAHAADGYLAFTVTAGDGQLEMRVAELSERGAQGVLEDVVVPGVGNVLEKVADDLRVEPSRRGGHEELVVAISF
jgi:hypothetical protein